jgi:uncharacterized protein DUF4382
MLLDKFKMIVTNPLWILFSFPRWRRIKPGVIPATPCSSGSSPLSRPSPTEGEGVYVGAQLPLKRTGGLNLALTLLLFFAPPASGSASQGTLEVRIKDHREAIGDFAKLMLNIDDILISPKTGLLFWQSGWKSLAAPSVPIELTKYVGKNSAPVFRGSIDAGSFEAIHLKLKEVNGVLKKNQRRAQVKDLVGPIKLPFEIRARGETIIVLDLVVLDMSDHPPQAYELGVKGYELYTNGKLIDKVPPGP